MSRPKFLPRGPNLTLEAQIPTLRLKSQPQDSNPSFEAQIPSSRLKSQPKASYPSLQCSNPCLYSNHNLKAQIPVLLLKFKPRASKPTTIGLKKKTHFYMANFAYEHKKKLTKIIGHLKALWKYFHLAPIWYCYLFWFRNGISFSKKVAYFSLAIPM